MLLIVLSICLAISAIALLAAMLVGRGASKHGTARLAALDHEFAATDYEEKTADPSVPT
jgi:hypothetical protein